MSSGEHPGPDHVELPAAIREVIIAHARAEDPNEACGLIIGRRAGGRRGRALRWEATRNTAASPYRYEIDPADLYRITVAADDADEVIWGIVHSHTHTPAIPSPTDLGLAFYPDALYLLVSLAPDQADPVDGRAGRPGLADRGWGQSRGRARRRALRYPDPATRRRQGRRSGR